MKPATAENSPFETECEGGKIRAYRLRNAAGMHCLISNYGARLLQWHVPDRRGRIADVVVGHDTIEAYLENPDTFFGATVGRVANRTSGAKFALKGKLHRLPANNGAHHLHGGPNGFHNKIWKVISADDNSISLGYTSPDGEAGYPGNLSAEVTYNLNDDGALSIDFRAQTDRETPVNLTNHAYFNLKGSGEGSIENHLVKIHADHFLEIDSEGIPSGAIAQVANTPFDFRTPAILADRLVPDHPQLKAGRGFDHHFMCSGNGLRTVAEILEPSSGRTLEVATDLPGIQFYTGNFLDGSVKGKGGVPCMFRSGFCFETQHCPDSLNRPEFPSIVLKPRETYTAKCVYRCGVAP